jgi:hypothetical protein
MRYAIQGISFLGFLMAVPAISSIVPSHAQHRRRLYIYKTQYIENI